MIMAILEVKVDTKDQPHPMMCLVHHPSVDPVLDRIVPNLHIHKDMHMVMTMVMGMLGLHLDLDLDLEKHHG